MGGIIDSVFGGGGQKAMKQSEKYTQQNYNTGTAALSPFYTQGGSAMGMMGNMLGLNGADAQTGGFKNYMDSTGYKFLMDSGSQAITDNAAARGLLNSGATAKALTTFGQNLAATKTQDFMNNLTNMGQIGANAAGNQMSGGNNASDLYAKQKQAQAQSKADAWGSMFNAGMSIAGMI